MKIILSRKGVDSGSGKTASPIFPDGRMLSLPIPDKQSPIRYQDIKWHEYDLGKVVSDLTNGRIAASFFSHLDPDLNHESLPRSNNWLPLFGQTGAAQGHLRNNNVMIGDIFLFFGLFRDVSIKAKRLEWSTGSTLRHVIWGWLQVGRIVAVDNCNREKFHWAGYHPHFHQDPDQNNTIYVAKQNLELPNTPTQKKGAGVFSRFTQELQLTSPTVTKPSLWELPKWFYPQADRRPLSYHGDLNRWKRTITTTQLNSVSRGQEFVLECADYPEATKWVYSLMKQS